MHQFSRGWIALVAFLVCPPPCPAAEPVVLVATNTVWRMFKGTAEPSPATPIAWREASFADAPWTESVAPFWFGEDALFGGSGTELAGMQNVYSTLYLRRTFSVANPAAFESLDWNALCDDGYVAWLNGHRVAARAAPAGNPGFRAVATVNATEPVTFENVSIPDPGSVLVAGENVLAVQVFNISLGSSDLVFDAELVAVPSAAGPPGIAVVSPTPGPVHDLSAITVTFTEPVHGVRAEDFLVNGASATGVTGGAAVYTFTFPPPAYGPVEISWSTFHTIEDFESPPQRFELATPGSTWNYERIDPEGPGIASIQPPSGITVAALGQVAVTFNKAVTGVDAADLLRNGIGATNVSGFGAGPYLFEFPPASAGSADVAWAPDHGIQSDTLEPRPFPGGGWSYAVDPGFLPAPLVLTEFMAETYTSYRDEEDDPEDWIEIWNPTDRAVALEGWSLSDSDDDPGRWVFPAVTIGPRNRLVVFASAKDRRPGGAGARLHTNFKLNPTEGYIGLFPPSLPRVAISEVRYDEQGPDYSLGRANDTGDWRFFKAGSPGAANGASSIQFAASEVHFSVPRGFFNHPFNLSLSCPTPGSFIRYTTNGSPPTETTGFLYTNSFPIAASRIVRAAAFAPYARPSRVQTHTYLVNLAGTRLRLPALSLVTATNNLFGRTGIMEVSPRNTTKRGDAWERPVSAEYIRPEDNGGFQVDCGIRVQGGDYVRGQYNYKSSSLPFSKYSFRLYFRGEYGSGRLEYPLFPETTQRSFDTIVLRAGMNDHSNPFLLDEYVRTLERDCEQPSAVGTFVHLFLNGVYKGYYNPCERIDVDFLRAYHGGGETWDVMAQAGEVREGDDTAWNTLRSIANSRDLSNPVHYLNMAGRLDLTNFVDYLCPLIYVDNDDWPHNNWRAARERVPGGLYRMYAWDAEWSFGAQNGHSPSWNTIANQLSSTAPPWGGADIQRIFLGLKKSPEFRLLFADRVHRHFFNNGALTDERLKARYAEVTNRLHGVVSGFNDRIGRTWIPQRRKYVLQHLQTAGFLASSNAPVFNQHGGRVPTGFQLTLTNLAGVIHYTTNETDPRVAFTGAVAPDAATYQQPLILAAPVRIRARSLLGTNWSALTEADFQVNEPELPLRITEIMYNPPGGEAFEFLEIANLGRVSIDVSGFSWTGLTFRFPEPSPLMPPGARWILANETSPTDFTTRYPDVTVAGWYDGSLSNGGERIAILDREGRLVTAVTYSDDPPWPVSADGDGHSLELTDAMGAADDPALWVASAREGGSPGMAPSSPEPPSVRLSEVTASPGGDADWIELYQGSGASVDLAGWSLSDSQDLRRFVFPAGTHIAAGGWLRILCSTNLQPGELVTGFGLDKDGETLALYNPSGIRIDAVTFGQIPSGFSLGRIGDPPDWQLCEPTPSAPNEPATPASVRDLSINEWLSNPPAGEDDWIELYNRNPSSPLPLQGLFFATTNALHRFGFPSFVPPAGFIVLKADDQNRPGHVGLRIPASGGLLALHDETGEEFNRVNYGPTSEGLALGRLPDGTGEPVPFPGTASPGAGNYLAAASGPRFNEWMAWNRGGVADPEGGSADWIELHNPGPTTFDLTGARLTFDIEDSAGWQFPPGASIPSGGFLLLWCDPDHAASSTATPPLWIDRGLSNENGVLRLFAANGQILDTAEYGPQLPDRPVGLNDASLSLLATPTPGLPNSLPAAMASSDGVRLNEWFAGLDDDDDWIELHNVHDLPVDLGGFHLTDDPSIAGTLRTTLPPLSLLGPGGHRRWTTDGRPERGPDHLAFSLDAVGESLRLYAANGVLIDGVDLQPRRPATAQGRFPDGGDAIEDFSLSASPGQANWLPHPRVVIHEILAHTDPPLEDAIEIYNPSAHLVDLGGWWLSDDETRLDRHRLPPSVPLAPQSYRVFYEPIFNPPGSQSAFTLSSAHGGEVWLTETDTTGNPTGYRAHAIYGATPNGQSLGRHRTSIGWDFAPLSRRTFGKDEPSTLNEFRLGTGLPNAYPLVGPILLTEFHFQPTRTSGSGPVEAPEDEFIEILNTGSQPIPLYDTAHATNTWRLRGGVTFDFPSGVQVPPGGFALVVSFATTNTAAVADFRSRYEVPASVPLFGPFSGRLSNEDDDILLERPDTPQGPSHPDAGFVPYLLVERIHYRTSSPWPDASSMPGASFQRRRVAQYGNDPANWILAPVSAGIGTRPPQTDRDADGMENDWEIAHGLNPDDPSDALEDPDGDGSSNLAEYLGATDPSNPTSVLRIAVGPEPSLGASVRFNAMAGRSYSLLRRDHPAWGPWERVQDFPASPADEDIVVRIDTQESGPWYYILTTPALP